MAERQQRSRDALAPGELSAVASLQPYEIVREASAGIVGAGAFLAFHYALAFPHWQIPGVDVVLEAGLAAMSYAGVRTAWAERPGLIERWLGLHVPLRLEIPDNDPETLRTALEYTVNAARPRLTAPAQASLDRVVEAVEAVLVVWGDNEVGREAAYTLRATIRDYLPDTLERYLKMPRQYAVNREVRDGKTSRDIVIEQLDILAAELNAIADDVNAGNAADLAAHGRFLDERFARQDILKQGR